VYHRKLSGDPGWGDREIRSVPLDWDADGRPRPATIERLGIGDYAAATVGGSA